MGGAAVKKRDRLRLLERKIVAKETHPGESFTFNHCIFRTFMKALKMRGSE